MRNHRISMRLAVLATTVTLLAACGGGSSSDAPPATPEAAADGVPAAATASVDAFTRFAATLAEDDQREPLSVADLVPPASETAEAAPVTR